MGERETWAIRSVSVGSAFKVGFVVGVVLTLLFVLPVTLAMLFGARSIGPMGYRRLGMPALAANELVVLLCIPFLYALGYGIVAALLAVIYNVVAALVGGLEVSVEVRRE